MIYLGLLLAIAVIGGVSAVGLRLAHSIQIRSAERELLAIGLEFRRALESYAEATPMGFPVNPETLQELLRDPRQPGMQRHLRRIYADPLTGKADWGLLRGPDRRILAIHSRSKTATFKRANFPPELESLSGVERHDEWIFTPVLLPAPAPNR
jgi:type II secretory pathway pseudopilin PulG